MEPYLDCLACSLAPWLMRTCDYKRSFSNLFWFNDCIYLICCSLSTIIVFSYCIYVIIFYINVTHFYFTLLYRLSIIPSFPLQFHANNLTNLYLFLLNYLTIGLIKYPIKSLTMYIIISLIKYPITK